MAIWVVVLLIGAAGLFGGLVNAFLAHEGFLLPRMDSLPDGGRIWRPGFLGNMLVGTVTAVVLAGLYSPLGSVEIGARDDVVAYRLTIAGLVGALLSGIGGARLLTNEVNRRFEQATTEQLTNALQEWVSRLPR